LAFSATAARSSSAFLSSNTWSSLRPLRFDLLARGVVGADQQVADDGASCASRSAVTETTAGKRLPSLRM
jgi:hypothetical protein